MATFTVAEIVEAAVKNGLKHVRGEWYDYNNEGLIGGCILGQTAHNLGVEGENLSHALNYQFNGLGDEMINLNDRAKKNGRYRSYKELVRALRFRVRNHLEEEVII